MSKLLFIFLLRLAVGSATHVGFLDALGHAGDIVGASRPERIYNLPNPKAVVDIGEDYDLNTEAIIRLNPDVLFLTEYDFETKGVKLLEKAGIRIVWIAEWKEEDPLRRAAWLMTFARFVGEEQRADSILSEVRQHYTDLVRSVPSSAPRKVLSGEDYRGTWYVPTRNSYMGKLIRDAGGQVTEGKGSKPLTIEDVIRTFGDAELWIGVQERTYPELRAVDTKHTWITAYKQQRVYNWLARVNAGGGNDFWETGAWRPDWILEDLIWAISGELTPHQPHFIQKLK